MKNKILISIIIMLILLTGLGFITNYIDSGRVGTNHEPKYCFKIVSNDGSKVTYWGLGYKVIRYVGVSPKEPYKNNIGAKMGSWFMKYDLPKERIVKVETNGTIIEITNYSDINTLSNILENSKYNADLCNGITTHKITIDNEVYYLKERCKEIQKGNKQAVITQEDLNTILKMIDNNK